MISSGKRHLINDKALLNSIWESYNKMKAPTTVNDSYMSKKQEEIFDHLLSRGEKGLYFASIAPGSRLTTFPMADQGIVEVFAECTSQIETTIALMEQ